MAQQYARDQPQGFKNRVENVAIVGVSSWISPLFLSLDHLLIVLITFNRQEAVSANSWPKNSSRPAITP